MKTFESKVAVITGAGSGIGRALALSLARRGAKLAISDVDGKALAETLTMCENIGARTVSYELDVSDRAAVYWGVANGSKGVPACAHRVGRRPLGESFQRVRADGHT